MTQTSSAAVQTHHVHLVVTTLFLGWVAHTHLAYGNNSKAQFVVLVLALFGGVLCWVWSNTVRQCRGGEPDTAIVPFGALDRRMPLVLAVFYAVIAILAIGRIL